MSRRKVTEHPVVLVLIEEGEFHKYVSCRNQQAAQDRAINWCKVTRKGQRSALFYNISCEYKAPDPTPPPVEVTPVDSDGVALFEIAKLSNEG